MKENVNINGQKLNKSLQRARDVLETEARAVLDIRELIDSSFKETIKLLIRCKGRVVFTGVGKSGHVARKLAATFASLGSSAFFVHAGEALHGDLGMISENDVLVALSHSGETEELIKLLPSLRRMGSSLVLLTGNCDSTMGEYADICLDSGVSEEACTLGLAPTTSSTAAMALGDALAVALSSLKGITPEDYALFHPGGSLGRKLLTKVSDVLEIRRKNPTVCEGTSVKKALFTMTDSNMGSTSVVDREGRLTGIVTDGDIRRHLEKEEIFLENPVEEVMTEDPITIAVGELAVKALNLMEEQEINDLPAVKGDRPVGMLNFQDLLRARVF